ncbi:MAG: hypothetical protein GC164_14955 [Phycisphaera sp.]|nr:hypothetical protein [Phycisphaera sp.]
MTTIVRVWACSACLGLSAIACATVDEGTADGPDTATPADAPAQVEARDVDAVTPAPNEAEVNDTLDRIAERQKDIRTLSAEVTFDQVSPLTGDTQRRFGTIHYAAGPPAKFAVHFDRVIADRGLENQDRWWVFDGTWLVERNDDKKQFLKRQITPPPPEVQDKDPEVQGQDPGNNARPDPLATGQGPFPIPLRADRKTILERFTVSIQNEEGEHPPLHLVYTPHDPRKMDYDQLHIEYDPHTLLPMKVRTVKEASGDERVFKLREVKTNEPVDESVFDTTPPSQKGERGWMEEITPWEK